jgi:hypothetical protein
MTNRIATSAEIASIDTWATSLGTVGSCAAVDVSWSETITDQDWVALTAIDNNEDSTEVVFVVTYNESAGENGVFNTADVEKTFTIDESLVPEPEASDEGDGE